MCCGGVGDSTLEGRVPSRRVPSSEWNDSLQACPSAFGMMSCMGVLVFFGWHSCSISGV